MEQVHCDHYLLTAGPSGPGGPSISIPLKKIQMLFKVSIKSMKKKIYERRSGFSALKEQRNKLR